MSSDGIPLEYDGGLSPVTGRSSDAGVRRRRVRKRRCRRRISLPGSALPPGNAHHTSSRPTR
ncbi:hypothetical protein KCP78_08920 [Salmonella enterica subsp. enterica]|nr:hypothetical protein KCP78_08920 [Salmonella enterica subsp. enterica]